MRGPTGARRAGDPLLHAQQIAGDARHHVRIEGR
jgi:hypothetical protein